MLAGYLTLSLLLKFPQLLDLSLQVSFNFRAVVDRFFGLLYLLVAIVEIGRRAVLCPLAKKMLHINSFIPVVITLGFTLE